MSLLQAVMLRARVLCVEAEKLPDVAAVAVSEKITFYDASYISVAKAHNLMLVTEDGQFSRAASKHVKTVTGEQVKAM